MQLKTFRIINYKSFKDTDRLCFRPGFNVIIGKNNAGKSSLLQVLSGVFGNIPHRSEETVPYAGALLQTPTSAEFNFESQIDNIERYLHDTQSALPVPTDVNNPSQPRGMTAFKIIKQSRQSLEFNYSLKVSNGREDYSADNINFIGNCPYPYNHNNQDIRGSSNRVLRDGGTGDGYTQGATWAHGYYKRYSKLFTAERMNISRSAIGTGTELTYNASNLPEVLHNFQIDRRAFDEYTALVSEVFPDIKYISVVNRDSNQCEIVVSKVDRSKSRPDLAVNLHECGTGVSQVLAILYAVVAKTEPIILIIDEPNSFLHPGAARKLIQILARYKRHQYIVATHSPELIKIAQPETVHVLQSRDEETIIKELDINKLEDARSMLAAVGADLTDIFAADKILWVEGETEADIFPLIFQRLIPDARLIGMSIVPLSDTGSIEGKSQRRTDDILKMYKRISAGNELVPRAVAFSMDPEDRSERSNQDIARAAEASNIRLRFLPRRMFENYLLNSEAVSTILNICITDLQTNPADVQSWIQNNGTDKKYFSVRSSPNIFSDDWYKKIHGAKFLTDLFSELTSARQVYNKREHGYKIADWILKNCPNNFAELIPYLRDLVNVPTD